jgi:hypothetical protein
LSKSRLETFSALLTGIIISRTVNLTHIAGHFSGSALVSSNYRRLQRFFQHVTLDEDAMITCAVHMLQIKPPWILALDRTNWKLGKTNINILLLCIVTQHFRIPLMWTFLSKQGNSTGKERIILMRRYLAIFDANTIKMFLADREFVEHKWIEFLCENNILFAIRIKQNSMIIFENGKKSQLSSWFKKRGAPKILSQKRARLKTMRQAMKYPLYFVGKRLKGELLIIVTNCENPKYALKIYRRRWQIECLFGDTKTRGMNFEDTHITDHRKLNTLLVAITLALIWSHACSRTIFNPKAIKKAAHGYKRKSWFRLGFDQLRNWLLNHKNKAYVLWEKITDRLKNHKIMQRVV